MSYDAKDIKSLSFREGARARIQMYLGSDDIEGVYQGLKEIINNSTDEVLAGYGNKIEIVVNEGQNSVSVRDYGRGCPFLVKKDGTNILVDIYTKAHTGGKFTNDSYKNSSGLNGVGGSCVCLSAEKFSVKSYRDGKCAEARFEKGINTYYKETKTKELNGTYVWFVPDKEVFKNGEIGFSFERICKEIKDISFLYKGLTFSILNEETREEKTFLAKNGIVDFVKETVKSPLNSHIIYATETDGDNTIEIAFQWGVKRETPYTFVNGMCCPEHGINLTGAKTSITRMFNSLSGHDFESDSIRQNLCYVMNFKILEPSFANQTKTKINSPCARTLASKAFSNGLKQMKNLYPNEFETILSYLKKIEKADAAAEKAREAILNHEKEQKSNEKKKLLNFDKLRDARRLGDKSMLLCVEGNSAGGSMSIGRDPMNEGILMFRGKAKNLIKATIEEGLQNEEVKLLLQALGITYGKPYDSSKLRYGKIALAVDSDFDGNHVALLLISMLQILCPEFIKENRLYWLRAPICKVETKTKTYYCYSNAELNDAPKGEITFYKGLGQMTDKDLKESMFSKEWRHLEPIAWSEEGIAQLYNLMGEEVEPRKDFVMNNIDFENFEVE